MPLCRSICRLDDISERVKIFEIGAVNADIHTLSLPAIFVFVTIKAGFSFRWNPKKMDELQRIREREREMNILRNMQLNRQNGEPGKF